MKVRIFENNSMDALQADINNFLYELPDGTLKDIKLTTTSMDAGTSKLAAMVIFHAW